MQRTTTPDAGQSRGKESHMASTHTLSAEAEVREFAQQFPTPNVERAVALCEAGTLTWAEVHEVFQRSLAQGLATVAA